MRSWSPLICDRSSSMVFLYLSLSGVIIKRLCFLFIITILPSFFVPTNYFRTYLQDVSLQPPSGRTESFQEVDTVRSTSALWR